MSNLKSPGVQKLIFIAAALVIFMVTVIWVIPNFRKRWLESFPPPRIEEVDDWVERSDSIDSIDSIEILQTRSSTIVRAEILVKSTVLRNTIIDSERFETSYIEYQVRVLEVFKGQIDPEDITEIFQYANFKLYDYHNNMLMSETRVIFTPLEVGDDLILFLLPGRNDRGIVTSQSAYLYTPEYARTGADNWVFEGHDPRNRLTLTVGDLLEITAAHRNTQN